MSFFKRLLNLSKSQQDHSQDLPVNAGTHVTTQDLIGLQQQARKLNLSRRSYARASTTGSHRSRFRGRGMDYQESRIYQAGDDIRNMDWRVTARSGKPHTKLYQEERERPVVFLLDLNQGMFFGSTKSLKSVVAAKTATLIAWSVAARGDRIGALFISPSINSDNSLAGQGRSTHQELAPKMGKRGALQLIRELVKHTNPTHALQIFGVEQTAVENALNEELKRLRNLAKPGSMIYLISDFYEINEDTAQHLQRLSQHNDIQAIQVVDPLEITPPPPNQYSVTDGKKTGTLNTRSKKKSKQYAQAFDQHHQKLKALMSRQNIPLLQISTADDVLLKIQQHFGGAKNKTSIPSSSNNPSNPRKVA